jgi:phosphomannomutase
MLYLAVISYQDSCGIMVTASHNPKEYNGFNLCEKNAGVLNENTGIKEIRNLVLKGKFEKKGSGQIIETNFLREYTESILKLVNCQKIKGLKIVVDAGNNVAGLIIPEIFKRIDCELIPLYFKPDGSFPNHGPDPLDSESLSGLQDVVKKECADLGIAFDGDADRLIFVDEKGRRISGDLITALLAKDILKEKGGEKVIYSLNSSRIVRETIQKSGGTPIVSRVGSAFIKNQMRKEKAIFAGEASGHYYFKTLDYTDNADLVMLKVMEILSKEKKALSELIRPFKKYWQSGEINFKIKNKEDKIREIEKEYLDGKISHLDGLTVEYKDWWFNVRPSNTEDLLRLVVEAETEGLMGDKIKEITEIIEGN